MRIAAKDLKVERFRATGNGGQNVNTRETAVRLTHRPTGLTATSQDERSQGQNYKRAMGTLIERIQEQEAIEKKSQIDELRDEQIGSGAIRIRTYDFSKNMVIDHRSGKKIARLQDVLDGNLELVR